MTSQHGQKQRSWRPEPDEYADAKAALNARGRSMSAYLRACLRWLNSDPDAALAALSPVWPEPRLTGRPRRTAHPASSTDSVDAE
ncbi:hypothetical protein F0L68_41160 [Solihabitans fulvus]|uniref:Uncharacterized protein n=1 Tax=Solihabitans fulvus TaxID=1892852 RepID=A0A5B2W5P8_9PSEU|nr:hypothetical protein [Solihabitans fulvus]KAA2245896.1 hypothetical protein F0L68_41160 [Solihabitans fulvus]